MVRYRNYRSNFILTHHLSDNQYIIQKIGIFVRENIW